MRRPPVRAAFTLIEAAATVAAAALLAAMLLVLGSESRRHASLGDDLANLRALHAAFMSYGSDNEDRVATFSWQAGADYGHGFGPADTPMQAAADQAVWILRCRAGREDIQRIGAWIPHLRYSHLVLTEYLDGTFPSRAAASPEDHLRLLWQSDPLNGYAALGPAQRPFPVNNANLRWPYSSSYELPPAFWSRDAGNPDEGLSTVSQPPGNPHDQFTVGNLPLGDRRLAQIALPAQKVMLFDNYQRHFGPSLLFFGYSATSQGQGPGARPVTITADGAAAPRPSRGMNFGFNPDVPDRTNGTIHYQPAPWEPPTLSGNEFDLVPVFYRFTRSGLRGRDFGGPPVQWTE